MMCVCVIACAFRWGVALVGFYSGRHCSPRCGTLFQVQGMCRETALTRGQYREENQIVALIYIL